jgi:transposase
MEFKRISVDTSKHVFTIHAVEEKERPVIRREIRRAQVEPFFVEIVSTEVVFEACAGIEQPDVWKIGGRDHQQFMKIM